MSKTATRIDSGDTDIQTYKLSEPLDHWGTDDDYIVMFSHGKLMWQCECNICYASTAEEALAVMGYTLIDAADASASRIGAIRARLQASVSAI